MPRGRKSSKKITIGDVEVPLPGQTTIVYDSIGSAAAALKVDVRVLRAAKRNGAPGFRGSRVYPADLIPWLEANKAKGGAENREAIENRILLAQLYRMDRRNEREDLKWTKNEIVVADIEAVSNELRTILRQKLENEYPPIVAGMEPAQVRVYSKRLVDELFRLIRGLKEKFRC